MATQLEPIVVTAEEENKQLEFEDIKDYLNAIEAGLSNFYDNTNFPDIGRLFQSYAIYDKLNTFSEIISDSDISGKLGFEASKMASALGGMKAGVAIAVNSPAPWTKHPLAILFAGSAGAYLGEAGVEQFETQIRNATNDLVNLFDTYGADSNTFQQAYSKSMLDLKTLALNSGFTPALQSKTLADELFGKLDSVASNYSVKNLTSNSNLSSLQQTTYLENGKPTTLFYSQDSNLLMHGDTIDNPNKISFVNEDGSYEVWEKVNGEFTQSIKIDIAPTKTLDLNSITTVSGGYGAIVNVKDTSGNDIFIVPDEYGNVSVYDNNGQLDVLQASSILNVLSSDNISDFSDTQQNISYVWNKNLISENFYSTLSRNIRNYLINESPSNDYSFTQNTTDTNTNPTTIFDLASQYNVSVSQLEAQNTWLKDRTSDSLPSVFNNSSYNTINIENNTGISYNYTYDDTSDSNQSGSINEQYTSQTSSATAYDAINFIANYDGTINELQEIQSAINDAYENYGLSQEYYQSFNESVATYIAVNTYYSTVTTQPTGESSSYDKNAFYYFNSIDETAPSLADKTYSILNENNIGLSVENLKLLDVNNDGKVSFIKSKNTIRFYQANSKKVA